LTLSVYCWGEGPLVVMMQGRSGSGTQFRNFIGPLAAAGFTAVCFDAPEHGNNPGKESDMPRFSATLIALQRQLGAIDCVIAHSVEAMAAAYAVQQGLSPRRPVLVAPYLGVQKMFETIRDLLNMRPQLAQRFHDKIGMRMIALLDGVNPWELPTPASLLESDGLKGMLVYDHEDHEDHEDQFREMIDYRPGCAVQAIRGLGHNRILKDETVIATIVDYPKTV